MLHFKRHLTSKKVSIIGIGQMGSKIALNYKKSGMLGSVHDVDSKKIPPEIGGHHERDLSKVLASDNAIVLMLPDNKSVEDICTSISNMPSNRPELVLDCSTISPELSLKLHRLLKPRGVNFMDCPVSGGVVAASEGTLTVMAGAVDAEIGDIKNLLAPIGTKIVACGGRSYGLIAKLCNNLILAVSMIGVSEAFLIAKKAGLSDSIFAQLVNSSSGKCWVTEKNIPIPGITQNTPANLDYNGGFSTRLISKDLNLAMQLVNQLGLSSTTLAEASRKVYEELDKSAYSGKDFSVVYKYISDMNDVHE